jgi:hypothetical protein
LAVGTDIGSAGIDFGALDYAKVREARIESNRLADHLALARLAVTD